MNEIAEASKRQQEDSNPGSRLFPATTIWSNSLNLGLLIRNEQSLLDTVLVTQAINKVRTLASLSHTQMASCSDWWILVCNGCSQRLQSTVEGLVSSWLLVLPDVF